MQLSEITVSRKHAVILHHACGDTFLVDVGSAHGTWVNNARVPPNSPYRLRRGSLIRFGSCQAPLFLFKAFERLERLLEDVNALTSENPSGAGDDQDRQESDIVKVVCGDSGVVCVSCNSNGEVSEGAPRSHHVQKRRLSRRRLSGSMMAVSLPARMSPLT